MPITCSPTAGLQRQNDLSSVFFDTHLFSKGKIHGSVSSGIPDCTPEFPKYPQFTGKPKEKAVNYQGNP
jgi:hypothetical protein